METNDGPLEGGGVGGEKGRLEVGGELRLSSPHGAQMACDYTRLSRDYGTAEADESYMWNPGEPPIDMEILMEWSRGAAGNGKSPAVGMQRKSVRDQALARQP
ncbi:unnamed protein product [Tetraodon nigroviridis]|uniref:(spotted green pufferfish) hypothetical protein n=1 Tax=Tetraodon nigroviridis TaxID=99883 RepID=Q4RUL8_TETNG|nr:unnamed protein product [Tetraodon nigroviridis]